MMRTNLQIIQSAIGDYTITETALQDLCEIGHFSLYSVELPDRYRGLPPVWHFAILEELKFDITDLENKKRIIHDARDVIKYAVSREQFPFVVISEDSGLNLNNYIEAKNQPIYFLSTNNLPGKDDAARVITDTPIILAVKAKHRMDYVPLYLSPYLPNKPANGWRFFGRKKEVREIVDSQSNYFVLGARRIGKTSILQEVKRQLETRGYTVYWVQVQDLMNVQQVVEEIAKNLSVREYYQAQQTSKIIDTNFLTTVIRKLKGDRKKMVLIFDEIGNPIMRSKRDDWNFMGKLRELSHNSEVRIIASAFQEIIIKQYQEFEGPFVNFGTTLRINVFSKPEIDEFIINPLGIWSTVKDKGELNRLIRRRFGSHPLILQYLGTVLFQRIFKFQTQYIENILADILGGDGLDQFENAYDEIFKNNNSYIERYLFIKLSLEASNERSELTDMEIRQKDIERLLDEIGVTSTLDERNFVLEKLNLRGLLFQDPDQKAIYRIASPIIFYYMKKYYSPVELCEDYLRQIKLKEAALNS